MWEKEQNRSVYIYMKKISRYITALKKMKKKKSNDHNGVIWSLLSDIFMYSYTQIYI